MKSYFSLSFFALISLLFLSSCEKEAKDVKLPVIEPKLVVSSLLFPQSPFTQVVVTKSAPIYNSNQTHNYEIVKGATVVISDGTNSWTLPYDLTRNVYALDSFQLKIKANTIYQLSVTTPDGKYVEASTSVPTQNTTLTYTTAVSGNSNDYTLYGSWQDLPNSTDYYRLETGKEDQFTASGWYSFDAVNISDEGNPGGTIKSSVEFPYSPLSTDTTDVALLTVSSEFYNYFSRIEKGHNTNDPFSEPFPLYTNIKGGLGIFAGFNQYRKKIVL